MGESERTTIDLDAVEEDDAVFGGDNNEEGKQETTNSKMTWRRTLYCVSNIAKMDFNLFGFYLNPYLLDAVGMDPFLVGMLLLSRQLWDAFSDPIVGNLSDNTHTKWGRRRPWIVGSFPFLGCTWILFWTILADLSAAWSFVYYLTVLLAYTTFNTFSQLPFLCLLQEIAPTYGIRTRIIALQEFCTQLTATIATFLMGELSTAFVNPSGAINYQVGYAIAGLILSPFIAFPRMISSLTIKEKPTDKTEVTQPILKEQGEGFDEGVKEVQEKATWREVFINFFQALKFFDFSLLVVCWTIFNTILFLFTSNMVLYVKYYIINESLDFIIVALLQLGFTLGFPLWVKIVPLIGKIRTTQLGCACSGLLAGGLFFIQRDQEILLTCLVPILGAFAAAIHLALCSMQPDCCAACMEKFDTKNEGMLYSIFLFSGKAGGGIALGLSSVALGWVGYEASLGETIEQNEATLLTLRILLFGVPSVASLILLGISFFIKDYQNEFSTIRHKTIHG